MLKYMLIATAGPGDRLLIDLAIKDSLTDITGYYVQDGYQLIKHLESSVSFSPCLFLVDLDIVKINGQEVLQYVRMNAALAAIPFYIITAANEIRRHNQLLGMGATKCFERPMTYEAFRNIVSDVA